MSLVPLPTRAVAGRVESDAIEALASALGADCVLAGDSLDGRHTADWSEAPAVTAGALLLPRTPQQVADALRLCAHHRQPVAIRAASPPSMAWGWSRRTSWTTAAARRELALMDGLRAMLDPHRILNRGRIV
jgi:FAD/FMN-containing dehydrogenase